MNPYYCDPSVTLFHGDCLDALRTLADASVDAVVTDPPYGLSFMGKKWDYDVPAVEVWAECLRVLKPGGHLLAFAGTRTQHRMAVRIEDAGFEIRDMIAWVYGSGFPKSLDVSKAIDQSDAVAARRDRNLRFTAWLRETGITPSQINAATQSFMGSHYLTDREQAIVPTREMFDAFRNLIGKIPDWVEKIITDRTIESENLKRREVVETIEKGSSPLPGNHAGTWTDGQRDGEYNITIPHTEAAKAWEGWGTALKPALEPITLARKPLSGTVAETVLAHGTGAINVDGCRVGRSEGDASGWSKTGSAESENRAMSGKNYAREPNPDNASGRWPANLIHDGSDEVTRLFPSDAGASAARFFYCPKASKDDRDDGLEAQARASAGAMTGGRAEGSAGLNNPRAGAGRTSGGKNIHPTVKPTDLMQYLCRLVTPPGGVVLDPFMGSGSTGKAALLEEFRFIGCEREAAYVELAKGRILSARTERVAVKHIELQRSLAL